MTDIETPVTIESTSGTALLCIDWDEESYYADFSPVANRQDWREIEGLLSQFGLEMMSESEHPHEPLEGGGRRIWCAKIPALFSMEQEGARWQD